MKQMSTTARNMILTPHAAQCKICHYSGYSNTCDYFSTGKCPVVATLKEVRKIT
ncbi:hypothetical protein ACFLUB_03360 [Chloroflexota bacterium]